MAQIEAEVPKVQTNSPFELGLYSFAEHMPDPATGRKITADKRLEHLLETIELADQVGLDVFGLGEHHRDDFVSSSPTVILGAAAARTKNIKLSTAVTVLSSDDPVRVFQSFATLDLISKGRAEIIAGRGSFIESFPLFGYDLNDYHSLFEEKLELLKQLREEEVVTWQGKHRAPLNEQAVYPRPYQDELPIWVAVGGTPESVVRAARLGLPLALAIIGGMPERFAPMAELYYRAAEQFGQDPAKLKVSINSHGFVADSQKEALDIAAPSLMHAMNKIGQERGWPPISRGQIEASADLRGADVIGGPDEVIEKILFQHEIFNHQRMLIQLTVGHIPHDKVLRAVELLGTKVAPVVREEIAKRTAQPA